MTKLILVAAPSGAGKSSFVNRICDEIPALCDIITYTTRSIRKGESPGNPYHFISKTDFEAKLAQNFFVEWAQVHVNLYGTSYESLEQAWAQNRCGIMDIDVQGTATLRSKFMDSKTIFILPPSIDVLRQRIVKRDGEMPKDLEIRMQNAVKEMQLAPQFDHVVVNDDFETSFAQFKKIIEGWLNAR